MKRSKPDTPLDELLERIAAALAWRPDGASQSPHGLDALIMDAVLRCNLLSWGRKDGGADRELIPQFAWEMGRFDHRTGKLVFRHPDSPLPEEYSDIAFNSVELEPWLRDISGPPHD